MSSFIPRSYLFVPGNRPERFANACAAGADVVIIDLEDAVPFAEKSAARDAVASWLSPAQSVLIRINGAGTEWFRDDLALCGMPGVAGIVLPKAERMDDIAMIKSVSPDRPVYPLIESAKGFESAAILARDRHVQRLMFGSIDFKLDLGIDGDGEELHYFRSMLVLFSRLAGIQPPIDGVTTEIDNVEQLRSDTLRARSFGFGGKLCIHPRQVGFVNQFFAPSPQEVEWARRVLAAAATADGAAVAVDGKMVDRPVILKAQRVMDEWASRGPAQGRF
ncbi:HpcH/HpaI aldolase/citrate lyase family protein [Noviherbaspirillum saxi]|uniref:CoA ester lyase n=1 Tax=Noviherbaspirillum saxi TaxID=2320863 RepID=A0A3A3FUJ0_9BURK|nr:CoA ester lyase [Noviherbaspirillum saxi]RJF98228.1 CoA ester lyase [Noviherbaspirillum saxi]